MTFQSCSVCEYYRSGFCVWATPVEIDETNWGCHKFKFSFHTLWEMSDKIERLEKKRKQSRNTIRRLRAQIKRNDPKSG